MLPLLFALALAQAEPPAAADAAPAAAAAPEADSDTPRGAPKTDYDFVAWCHGALTGHMALYHEVKPELDSIERPGEAASDAANDRLRAQAGREYLALYTRALTGVDHGRPGGLLRRREAADAQGAAIWNLVKDAPARTRMWAWVGWDLPGRCETAAKSLETPAGRLAALHAPASAADAAPEPVQPPTSPPASIEDAISTSPGAPPPADSAAPPSLRGPQ